MIVQRVEKHLIKQNNSYYPMFCDFAHKSKNLYNHANYLVRNEFIKNDKWLRYGEMDKILKADLEFDDYKQMPTAQSAQQILRLLEKDWKSFFAAIKDWSKNKDKYLGRPKLPRYKSKDGKHILILTNQNVKLKEDVLIFPKTFNGFTLNPQFIDKDNFVSFQQVRFVPNYNSFTVELIYNIEVPDVTLPDNERYLSVDIGLDNLATVVNNVGLKPVVINGKGLKSMNKYYNKQISHYREVAKRMNGRDYTNRMDKLTCKRNHKIDDYMHKASKFLIDYAIANNFNTIVIGNNKEWKQESSMSKRINQSFVGIPHMRFIEMIQYKAQNVGLNVILTEESYTSGTSFLDNEEPIKENYNKTRRVKRGLFISNNGTKINADVNGAYQIMKKVFPNVTSDGIQGVALHPVRVSVA
ncbi:MAG: transposase [Cellulosilyticum sp.]|nr:transposase [Cellulosilyticum sp.]